MYSHCYVHSVARCTAWQLAVAMCRGARTGPSQRARRPVDVSLSSVKGRQGNKRSGQRPICAVLHAHMQPVMAACHYTRAITKRIASVVGQSAWRSAHGQRQAGSALAAASSGAAVAITGCSTATAATGVLSASALSAWRSHVPVVPGEVHVLWMQLGTQRGPEDKVGGDTAWPHIIICTCVSSSC